MTSAIREFLPINMTSVKKLTGGSQQAMVYGTTSTGWEWVQSQLQTRPDSPIARVFNYVIGDDILGHEKIIPEGAVSTLEGTTFTKISSGAGSVSQGSKNEVDHKRTKRICKAGLVNWGLEVWKRRNSDSKIPLIFTIDIDDNRNPLTAENALSKTKIVRGRKVNDIITHAEIRRLAKLCKDESIDKEVRDEIQKNIIFVRLKKVGDELALEQVPLPWEDSSWTEEHVKRKKLSAKVDKDYDWRKELNAKVAAERNKTKESLPVASGPTLNPDQTSSAGSAALAPLKATKALEAESPKDHDKPKVVSSPKSKELEAREAEQRLMQSLFASF